MSFKTNEITISDYLTLAQVKTIPKLVEQWFVFDEDYTFDDLLEQQTKMFASNCANAYNPEVIRIEKLEWVGNWRGRKNDYGSDITVWVTAIVDCGGDRIVRQSFDLLDSMSMTSDSGCSGSVHQPHQ